MVWVCVIQWQVWHGAGFSKSWVKIYLLGEKGNSWSVIGKEKIIFLMCVVGKSMAFIVAETMD